MRSSSAIRDSIASSIPNDHATRAEIVHRHAERIGGPRDPLEHGERERCADLASLRLHSRHGSAPATA